MFYLKSTKNAKFCTLELLLFTVAQFQQFMFLYHSVLGTTKCIFVEYNIKSLLQMIQVFVYKSSFLIYIRILQTSSNCSVTCPLFIHSNHFIFHV